MATKTVKKAAAKPAAAKKAPVKKSAPAAKKPATKKAAVKEVKMAAPVMEKHACGCGADCKCGGNCHCGGDCHCGADCHCAKRGSKFGRFMRKLILFIIIFALGFAAAKLCCCSRHHGPRMHFVNGCLDAASVKCPKLLEALPAMDINQDGCITRDEFRAVKRQMRAEVRDIQVQEVEVDNEVVDD